MKKNLALALIALTLTAGSIGYAVSQLLIQRSLTAQVTVLAVGDIGFTTVDGEPLTSLDYGVIPPGVWVNRTIVVHNTGNAPLSLTCKRLDASSDVSTNFAHPDGSWFQPSVPKPMPIGGSVTVVIGLQGGAAGVYSLEFQFTAEG